MIWTRGDQSRSRDETARSPDSGVRGRRRGPELEDALLQAAWDEVSAVGYANLTMEGVAARAGTSKTVLYRRWPKRAELVVAAFRRHVVPITSQIPDTGDLRGDVLTVLRQVRQHYQEIGPGIIHGLLAERPDLPEDVFEVVPEVMMSLLRRAAERGEVRLEEITPRMAALPGDLLRHELLLSKSAATDAFLAEVVNDIFLPLVTAPEPLRG